MYGLCSGWMVNTDLGDLDPDTVGTTPKSTRKDLVAAHQLAAERNDLDYYKNVLRAFQAEEDEKEAAKAAKASKKTTKGKRKSTTKVEEDEDEDVDMADAGPEIVATPKDKTKSKKRKATADEEEIVSCFVWNLTTRTDILFY